MDERDTPDRLKSLGERVDKARRDRREASPPSDSGGDEEARSLLQVALGLGSRVGVELVAALAVGLGIGWSIDRLLGTRPWGIVVFVVLGIAAGMLNVWRAVTGQGSAIGFRGARQGRDRK